MGLLSSLGLPITLVAVIANFIGAIRINWYWFVPWVAAYSTLIFHIIVFGVTYQESFLATVLTFTMEITFFSAAYCMLVRKLFKFRFVLYKNIENIDLLKLLLNLSFICFVAFALLYALHQFDRSSCSIRCQSNFFVFGMPPYVGSAVFPLIILSVVVTLAFLLFIVGERKK